MNDYLALMLTIVTGIYQLESQSGLRDSCLYKGGYNGYGFASNRICFKTPAEAQGRVYSWVSKEYLSGKTVNQLLCKYQGGKPLNDCEYARKFRALNIKI